jgi:hypothetical protein
LLDIIVLEEDYSYECPSSIFAISKKNGTIKNDTDFRKFILLLKRKMKPFAIPKIGLRDIILSSSVH